MGDGCVQFLGDAKRFHRAWVRLGSRVTQSRLPLFPQQQTFLSPAATSAKCHVWTAPVWQELSSRFCSIGRCSHVKKARSEEHTSELQSHLNLVCRLLLEKKKNTRRDDKTTTL